MISFIIFYVFSEFVKLIIFICLLCHIKIITYKPIITYLIQYIARII